MYFNGSVLGSVADWSNASGGYEVLGGKSVALVQDPLLGNEQVSDLPAPAGLAIKRDSPLRSLGLNLTSPQWRAVIGNIGEVNFFGRPVNRRSIGAE